MSDWVSAPLVLPRIGPGGWLRVLVRGLALGLVAYGGLALLVLLRLIERPLCGPARPLTPHIAQWVCKAAMVILRLRLHVQGAPMPHKGATVANHSSWLDIFALNAAQRVYFVSKSEVAGWPGIGWLARATGTVFIARKGSEAKLQQQLFEDRLRAGHRLAFFPEGTSTDTLRILAFKSTLFAAFFTHGLEHVLQVQPVSINYEAPFGRDARFYGWWGNMDFAPHLLAVLAQRRQGRVTLRFHPPVAVDAFADRKALAAHCGAVIRAAHGEAVIRAAHRP